MRWYELSAWGNGNFYCIFVAELYPRWRYIDAQCALTIIVGRDYTVWLDVSTAAIYHLPLDPQIWPSELYFSAPWQRSPEHTQGELARGNLSSTA